MQEEAFTSFALHDRYRTKSAQEAISDVRN